MARFIKCEVVVIPFPFSSLKQVKKRPAVVIAKPMGDDLILCQITSKAIKDEYAIELLEDDFKSGGLRKTSHVRPNKIFTVDQNIVLYKVGIVKKEKINAIIQKIIEILNA